MFCRQQHGMFYFVSCCLCFNILCVKSLRLMERRKQIIGKLTCIECDIFREEQITWNTTLLRIKLAGGFESNTQTASKRKDSSIKYLLRAPRKRLIKKLWSKKKFKSIKGLFTWREGAPANQATRVGLTSHTFLLKTHRSVYMLDRVACLPGAPCLLAWGTRLGGVAFYHVNGLSRAISANRGEIKCENMAAQSESLFS